MKLFLGCNDATLRKTGFNLEDLEQKPLSVLIDSNEYLNLNTMINEGHTNIEIALQRINKESIVCELLGTVIYDEYNDILGVVILLHDISERKRIAEIQNKYTLKLEESNILLETEIRDRLHAENIIRHFVYHDALTKLPNRKKILEDVEILINKKERFAIFFINLDNFKNINDSYGHQAGDYILKTVAERFTTLFRSNDIISRMGGDEFIVIFRDIKSTINAEKIAVKIMEKLRAAFFYNGNQLFIGGSIGISIFPEHGTDVDTLIKNADLAMYEVKHNGGYGYAIYSPEMNEKAINKSEMRIKINNALENNEFIAYYQPIIDLKLMKVLHSEALIRWYHKDIIIPPIEFILNSTCVFY